MKKALMILSIFAIAAVATCAYAGPSEDISIKVTVTYGLSVSLSGNEIQLGTVAAGSSAVESAAITLTNDGTGVDEIFELSETVPSAWTSGAAAGVETYVLKASFDGGAYEAANGAASGVVALDGTTDVTFEFTPPTKTAETSEQTIGVTVTATLGQ